MTSTPDIDYTATATLVGIAYQLEGKGAPREQIARRISDLIAFTTEVAPILQAATTTPSDDKFPQTVVGVLRAVDGNGLYYNDDDADARERQVFAGFDPISRAALREAQRIIEAGGDRKAWISFGWQWGKGAKGDTWLRRLYRVAPLRQSAATSNRPSAGSRPELSNRPDDRSAPQSPPPADGYTPPPARNGLAAAPQPAHEPSTPTEATELCDGASDALYAAHALLVAIVQAGPSVEQQTPGDEHYQILGAAVADMDRRARVALSKSMALNYNIRDITRPATARELALVIDGIVAHACGQAA